MSIKYACFISYPHPKQGKEFKKIIDKLEESLADQLGYFLDEPIYCDKDRLKPGYNYNEALAKAICESACMIVVFTSLYLSRSYCLREFLAMEQIELERRKILGEKFDRTRRMIIPIVIKGDPEQDLPDKISQIHYWDLTKILNRGFNPKSQECRTLIRDIANEIHLQSEILKDLKKDHPSTQDCNSFKIPPECDAKDSWKTEPTKPSGFPLRYTSN
jgi:hypothetical protein